MIARPVGPLAASGAGTALGRVPAARIASAIADAAERWSDGDFPPRVRALAAICARTGYREPVAEYALDAAFGAITPAALAGVAAIEAGGLDALDGAPFGDPPRGLRPAGRATIVSSDTTIGVALFPLVFALLAKCDVVVKDRSDDLIAAFAATLAEERPEFARALRVERWERHDDPAAARTLAASDVVVAFGNESALRAIRAGCASEARFAGYGHRTSLAYVEREALDARGLDALADRIARDALLYDGDGCLSPHAIAVERGAEVSLEAFATALALAFERAAIEFPVSPRGAASVHARAHAESFRRAQTAGISAPALFRGRADEWLLLVNAPQDAPPPLESCIVATYPVDDPAEAARFFARHAVPLEAAGVASPDRVRPDVAEAFAGLGVRRIAALGEMQRPALGGPHGGVARLLPFVRYVWHD